MKVVNLRRFQIYSNILTVFLVWSFSVFSTHIAFATLGHTTPLLNQIIERADIVATLNVVDFVPDPPDTGYRPLILELKPSGIYKFHLVKCLKGQCAIDFSMHLPAIQRSFFNFAEINITKGSCVLGLLHSDGMGVLAAEDTNIPMVPLSNSTIPTANKSNDGSVLNQVFELMLGSLGDPQLRKANTYLLRLTQDSNVIPAMVKYLDDPDLHTQGSVFECLATNQQVSAIPRIAKLVETLQKSDDSSEAVLSLRTFTAPEALPYLNILLWNSVSETRSCAILSIDRLADRTSVPYLILALRDPSPDQFVVQSSWGMLRKLVPELDNLNDPGYYPYDKYWRQHRQQEMDKIYAWWSAELEGKHLAKDDPGFSGTIPNDTNDLNKLFFSPYQTAREAAMDILAKSADSSSVPYLILALLDPDTGVAFSAYNLLGRLIPELKAIATLAEFNSHRDTYVQPVYNWWNDDLLGKHNQPAVSK